MSEEVAKKPRLSRGIFFIVVMLLCIAAIALFIVSQRSERNTINIATGGPSPVPVSAVYVRQVDHLEIREQFSGLVKAKRSSALGFETGGRIAIIGVDIGDRVKKGQNLASLDTRSLEARLDAARAQVSEARASQSLAEATVSRQKLLEEKGLLSAQSFDEASAQRDAAIARVGAAEAQVQTLEIQIDLATISAPFGGVITRRLMDEGAIAGPGQPLLQLVEDQELEVTIGIPAGLQSRFQEDELYTLFVGKDAFESRFRKLTGVIDENFRTVSAVFDLPSNAIVAPGDVTRLELVRTLDETGYWIPLSAMAEADRGLWSVFGVTEDQTGAYRINNKLVEVIHSEAERVFVRGAIQDGDLIVAKGLHRIVPGIEVSPNIEAPGELEGL